MTKPKLRIAVAGLGRIGWNFHSKRLAEHPDFDLVAVADADPGRCREAEETLRCQSWPDFYEMIGRMDLDAVVIATPTHLHRDMASAAFGKGLHVLLEKPMAANLRDAESIVRKATRTKRILTVYQPHRLNAYFQHLLSIVNSGVIGRVYWVERGSFSYSRRNDWQSLQRFGGGMLNNYGAHYLDQLLQLIGYDVKRVFCDLQLAASLGDADDVVKIVLETRRGVLGEVNISQASMIRPYDLLVWGTCGGVVYAGNEYTVRSFDPAALPPKALDPSLASQDRKYPSDQIDVKEETIPVDPSFGIDVFADFANAIRSGAPPVVEPRQTLALMRVLDRCRQSSGPIRRA